MHRNGESSLFGGYAKCRQVVRVRLCGSVFQHLRNVHTSQMCFFARARTHVHNSNECNGQRWHQNVLTYRHGAFVQIFPALRYFSGDGSSRVVQMAHTLVSSLCVRLMNETASALHVPAHIRIENGLWNATNGNERQKKKTWWESTAIFGARLQWPPKLSRPLYVLPVHFASRRNHTMSTKFYMMNVHEGSRWHSITQTQTNSTRFIIIFIGAHHSVYSFPVYRVNFSLFARCSCVCWALSETCNKII